MDQRLSVITVGADDLSAMKNFYSDKLGWRPVAENKDNNPYVLLDEIGNASTHKSIDHLG